MRQLGDLLATIPIPDVATTTGAATPSPARMTADRAASQWAGSEQAIELVTDLAAGLPAGHLHLWGGPDGAGKTSFLLTLLAGAAQCQRRVLYASYDLSAATLAHRLLAMTASVAPQRLPDPGSKLADVDPSASPLDAADWDRVRAARRYLSGLPFTFLEARGFTAESLRDRLARMPFRADVLAVDYLQAVVRERDTTVQAAVSQLRDLAHSMYVSIVCAVRPDEGVRNREIASRGFVSPKGTLPDRVGWIEPAGKTDRRADVVVNRHGPQTSNVLRVHESGALERRPK